MINAIKYYYNINVDDIEQVNDDYYFDNYILRLYYKPLDIDLYNMLISNNIYVHQIIYNIKKEYVTIINHKAYILLKVVKDESVNLSLIEKYNILLNKPKEFSWDKLWSVKVDYYEKNIANIKDKIIKQSFNYFIGMAENAILIYKSLQLSENMFLCHLRFNNDMDFYDPLNYVVDYKMRDYAEYIKKEFYYNDKTYYDYIKKIINENNYNNVMLFFVRMLYPSLFFDEYDNYMKDDNINYVFYTKKDKYEKYLQDIYDLIKRKYNIINISWLQKKIIN